MDTSNRDALRTAMTEALPVFMKRAVEELPGTWDVSAQCFICPDESTVTPADINRGLCEEFAYYVKRVMRERCGLMINFSVWWDNDFEEDAEGTHAFIEFNFRFYDSECLDGVDDWRNLPYFRRMSEGNYSDSPDKARSDAYVAWANTKLPPAQSLARLFFGLTRTRYE